MQDQKEIHKMVNSKLEEDREIAAELLGEDFLDLPNRSQACEDLHKLTLDKDSLVRLFTVPSVAINFAHIHNNEEMWIDLHRLSFDPDILVKFNVAYAMEAVFYHLNENERKQALEDLYRLRIADEHSDVRKAANYSLGKLSIYKASEAENEDDYKCELETAIQFFEKSSEASTSFTSLNPANFCLPFYRSFYSIVFKKQSETEEIEKYLSEAKNAINESKNKKLLFEAIRNLASTLKEVQNLDFEDKKEKLNSCRKYCGIAVEIMKNTEKAAPYATELIRKGLPILDRKLKSLLEEIQEKATTACRESKGTDTEEIACAVSREVQKWEIGSQEEMSWYVENLVLVLKSKIPHTPENREILERIELLKDEKNLTRQYSILPTIIGLIPTVNVIPEEGVTNRFDDLKRDIRNVNEKLDQVTISLKSGISQELVITAGGPVPHFSIDHVVTISLQEISYPELEEDLEKIKGETIDKLSKLPKRLGEKVEEHLIQNRLYDVLKKLI